MVAAKAAAKTPQATREHGPDHVRPGHDDPMMKELHELMEQLTPEQRAALHEYLHAQLKAAGIEMPNLHHGKHGS
jgi:Spy/CpxP family protein refolding chaperone